MAPEASVGKREALPSLFEVAVAFTIASWAANSGVASTTPVLKKEWSDGRTSKTGERCVQRIDFFELEPRALDISAELCGVRA